MKKNLGKQIVVIDNGFVHVGDCEMSDSTLVISNAVNVRRWGTTTGLGQLCTGPLKETTHDRLGTVIVPSGRVVFFVKVVGGWDV